MTGSGSVRWHADRDRVWRLAAELVSVNSVNPTFGGPAHGETEVATRIAAFCRDLGLDVELQEVLPGRHNVIARLRRGPDLPTLAIEGHVDTVGSTALDAFEPRVADGRLHGRGACDTKGGIASALHALEGLMAIDDLDVNIEFIGAVDEEATYRGVLGYLATQPAVDAAIVIEPTSLVPVIAHAGVLRGLLRTQGAAAHSATPELGRNAITLMTEAIAEIDDWVASIAPPPHALCGPTSFSVTTIHGGTGINVIPEECVAEFDWRLHPAVDPESVLARLRSRIAEVAGLELADVVLNFQGLDTAPGAAIVRACQDACEAVTGSREVTGTRGGTDASKFSREAGIPSVVLGPGSIAQAHTVDEWVDIEELARGAEIYVEIARRLAQTSRQDERPRREEPGRSELSTT
jgi:acetylornithine deacetylase